VPTKSFPISTWERDDKKQKMVYDEATTHAKSRKSKSKHSKLVKNNDGYVFYEETKYK
jgi:phage pi2 protein 07